MSKAIDALVTEHAEIRSALSVLGAMLLTMEDGEEVPGDDLADLLDFLTECIGLCHHGKEEHHLFPALEELGVEEIDEIIPDLLTEHERAKELTSVMKRSIPNVRESVEFSDAAADFTALYDHHIEDENRKLFPLAEKFIPRSTLAGLAERFESFEEGILGRNRRKELRERLESLASRYLD